MSSAGLEEMEKQMPRTAGKPVVSIGMPVYNAERYLARAVDSLLKQDYADFELILSDNASTDGTWTLCREYAERDKRVRIYQNERNRGAVENFKRVCDAARGDYFMWAAADDYWLPGFVSALVKALEADPSAGVAMTAFERVREDGTIQDAVRYSNLLAIRTAQGRAFPRLWPIRGPCTTALRDAKCHGGVASCAASSRSNFAPFSRSRNTASSASSQPFSI